jgi:tRNA G18 (ribose-2'-O)-methylase SpoU
VPFARAGSAAELVDTLMQAGFEVFALSPAGRENLSAISWPERSALLLGTEGEGLPAEILARLRTVSIPMPAGFDSLNVATTAGIALWEARRAGL